MTPRAPLRASDSVVASVLAHALPRALARTLPLVGALPALLGLLTGCDRKGAEALLHTEVPTLSVPAKVVEEPTAPPPAAAKTDALAVPYTDTGSEAAGPAEEDRERLDRRAGDGSSRRRRGASRSGRGAEVGEELRAPSKASEPGLGVARMTLAKSVASREPVGALSSLRAGELQKFSTFIELTNETGEASSITVTLSPDGGGGSSAVTLPVSAERRFRTWANLKAPRQPGAYHVVVRDDHGRTLARSALRVSP